MTSTTKQMQPNGKGGGPRGAGRPKFNQLEMVTTFTYKSSLVRIIIVVTDPQTNKHTHKHTNPDRTDYNTLRRSFTSAV